MSDLLELQMLQELELQSLTQVSEEMWYQGNLRFLLHPAQCVIYDAFWSSNWRETVTLAARRFGKSTLGFILCLEYAIRNPYRITRFIPPEIKQAWQICLPTWGWIQRRAPRGLIEYVAAEKAWRVGQQSWLFLGGFDSQEDAQRGGEASFIVCDEGGSTNPEQYDYILKSVLKPQLLDTKGRMLHLGTVPEDLAHPFLTDTVDRAEIEGRLFTFTINDNPRLDDEQRQQAIDDCGGVETEAYRREYLCERVRTPHLMVCPEWRDSTVTNYMFPQYAFWNVVGDYGGVQDKTVFLSGWYCVRTFKYVVWDERVYDPHTPTDESAQGVKELIAQKSNLMVRDPMVTREYGHSEQDVQPWIDVPGQVKVDLHKLHNLDVRVPTKDDFDAGIQMLNELLRRGKIVINPRCTFLIKSCKDGKLNKRRTDYERTNALGHCDGVAALIYFCRMINMNNPFPPDKYNREQTWYTPKPGAQEQLKKMFEPKKPSWVT